jgi:hypothetical protein
VIDGPHQGKTGSLVWLFAIETEPEFLVEFEVGDDVRLQQSQLYLISHGS